MKIHISIFIFICFFLCCSNKLPVTVESTNYQDLEGTDSIVDTKLLYLYFKSKSEPDSSYSDSAICIIDSMLYMYKNNENRHFKYALQKIHFLTLASHVDCAINFIEEDSCMIWEKVGGPYYKEILKHRLLAMNAKKNRDTILYRKNLQEALGLVEKYISENEQDYIAFLREGLSESRGKFLITSMEYIYFSYLLYGEKEADKRLNAYHERYQINEESLLQFRMLYSLDIMDFMPI